MELLRAKLVERNKVYRVVVRLYRQKVLLDICDKAFSMQRLKLKDACNVRKWMMMYLMKNRHLCLAFLISGF